MADVGGQGPGIIDMATGRIIRVEVPRALINRPLVISPDGRWLAQGGEKGEALIYAGDTGQIHARLCNLPGQGRIGAFSLDSKLLLTLAGNAVQVWNVAGRKLISVVPGGEAAAEAAVFSPDSTRIAVAYSTGTIARAETATGKIEILYPPRQGAGKYLRFSPDGKQIATISGKRVLLWPADPWPFILSRTARQLTKEQRVHLGLEALRPGEKKPPEALPR
jgi:WD40 repeat protein